jgi:hypothetical protein
MAPPSNLLSAADIAAIAREKHIARVGAAGEEMPEDLGEQADYFYDRQQLVPYFIRSLGRGLINWCCEWRCPLYPRKQT